MTEAKGDLVSQPETYPTGIADVLPTPPRSFRRSAKHRHLSANEVKVAWALEIGLVNWSELDILRRSGVVVTRTETA